MTSQRSNKIEKAHNTKSDDLSLFETLVANSEEIFQSNINTQDVKHAIQHHILFGLKTLKPKAQYCLNVVFRANIIMSNENKKLQEFHLVSNTIKPNDFPSHKPSYSFKQIQLFHNEDLSSFKVSLPYSTYKEFSEPIKRILPDVGIGIAIKPYFILLSIFRNPQKTIDFEEKRGLISYFLP